MPHLNLTLLSAFQATLDNARLTSFHSVKVQALLAYLALEADRAHHREALATLLWPLDAEASARSSLRQALYELRKMLGDRNDSPTPFLLVTRQTVQFNRASDHRFDVADFLAHLRQGQLAEAATCYRGDLLSGLSCESEPFEEWLRLTRAHLHNLAVDACGQLTQRNLDEGSYTQAKQYAQQQLALEPWREEAHRQLMTTLALNGERSAALAQYEICRRTLLAELRVEPVTETTALYNQILAGQLTAKRAPSSAAPPSHSLLFRHNLPAQPTAFVGRKTDLDQIAERLNDPTCRLLTIVGPGGMGKTRLAIQVAQRILDAETTPGDIQKSKISDQGRHNPKFSAGVCFVALAGIDSPDLLVSSLATALNFTFYGGDAKIQLLDYLRARSLLLVLDNCEHLLDGIELVADLLAAAPGVKVLATSREPLNLREEWLHPLTGMSFPTVETYTAPLESYSAVQFFVQCARQMKLSFDLATEAAAVVRICRLVDGIPLAIELAAAWLKFYACTQIVDEITHSLDFLATNLRNIPPRHRSMRAVFEHSWALLTPQEQGVFARLAIFRGGFQLEAAQQVADATRPLLLALVEKSLLQLTPSGRFQLHELLRQFVEERLLTQPEALLERQKRHSHFYLIFLQRQEAPLKGREQLAALTTIEGEIENIRSAWQRALTHLDIETLARAVDALYVFYLVCSWFKEGLSIFKQAATALAMSEPTDQRGILWGKLLFYQASMDAKFDWAIGGTATTIEYDQGVQQGIAILQLLGAAEECSLPFRELGEGYRWLGQFDKMRECNQQALRYAEAKGDRWEIGQTLYMSGFGCFWIGEYEAAIEFLQRGVGLGEDGGGAFTLSNTLNVLSRTYRALGDYKHAQQAGQSALAIRTRVGDRYGMAWSQQVLGDLYWRMGDYATAQRYSQASLDLFREIGFFRHQAIALNTLGNVACSLDQLAQANACFRLAISCYSNADPRNIDFCVAETMVGLATVRLKAARLADGAELLIHVLHNPGAWRETKEWANRLLATLPAELVAQAATTIDAQDLMRLVTEVMTEAD